MVTTPPLEAVLLVTQLSRGLTIGLLCLVVALSHALAFAAGYWYFVRRNHQADGPSVDVDEERRAPG